MRLASAFGKQNRLAAAEQFEVGMAAMEGTKTRHLHRQSTGQYCLECGLRRQRLLVVCGLRERH